LVWAGLRTQEGWTLGCSIAKTHEFRQIGGFPSFDSGIFKRIQEFGFEYDFVDGLNCYHIWKNQWDIIAHTLRWLTHAYNSRDYRFGLNLGIVESFKSFFRLLLRKKPSQACTYLLWLIKALIVFPCKKLLKE
jgi:hypothetical protein